MKLSLVVPVYKGESLLVKDFNRKFDYLASILSPSDFELIYVFDGSEKNSARQLEEKIAKDSLKNVVLVTRKENKGKGFSVVQGMHYAQGDLIGYFDFGFDLGIEVLGAMIDKYDQNPKVDAIIANKYHPDSNFHADWKRKLSSWGYLTWVFIATGVIVPDSQTGVKVYKREAIKAILPKLLIKRFAFEVEVLSALLQNHFDNWDYVPVHLNHKDASTVKLWDGLKNDVPRMFIDTMAVGYRKRLRRWYTTDVSVDTKGKTIIDSLESLINNKVENGETN